MKKSQKILKYMVPSVVFIYRGPHERRAETLNDASIIKLLFERNEQAVKEMKESKK